MEPDATAARDEAAPQPMPAPGEHVLVRCPGFRCLAYRNADGTWRSVFGNRSIPEVLEVVSGSPKDRTSPAAGDGIDDLLDRIDSLPPAPRVLPRLLSALSNTETDLNQVVDLVAIDTGLTAKLLRTCNSAFFGTSRPVENVSEAVHRLGFQTVYRTLAVVSGAHCFKGPEAGRPDADRLWRHSVTVAFAAQFIAEDVGLNGSLLFTTGILHDLGKVVLAASKQGAGALLVADNMAADREALAWERTTYGFSHADVGGRMLERWHFSDQLAASVRFHHDPGAGGDAAPSAACVALADTLAHRLELAQAGQAAPGTESPPALRILGLAEAQLHHYDDRIRENLQFVEAMCRI